MKLTKENNIVNLQEDEMNLGFYFAGNGDLYWKLTSDKNVYENNTFIITKENYDLYSLFEQLFTDLKEINIFEEDDLIPFYIDDDEERKKYLREKAIDNELKKERFRLHNLSNYNDLYNDEKKTITWYSDETNNKVANYLVVKKEDECFKVEFNIQDYKEGYDKDFNSEHSIPIRFRNSGSFYKPFNILFMRMFKIMCKLDDINDIGHQIKIEEYQYNQKIKKLTK